MSGTLPPLHEFKPDDQSPFVVIVAFSFIVITILISIIRGIISSRRRIDFQPDDATFAVSAVLAITTSVIFYRAVLSGLGTHQSTLSRGKLETYFKLIYAAQLLGVAAMSAAKMSLVLQYRRIAPSARTSFLVTAVLVSVWFLLSTILFAFQCQIPKPWVFSPGQCSTHGKVQYPIIILNIVSDAALAIGLLPTVWHLQMRKEMRMSLALLFGSRIVVSFVAIPQMISAHHAIHSTDQTWARLGLSIWDQVVVHFSVISATMPRTHKFWSSLATARATAKTSPNEYELSGESRERSADASGSFKPRLSKKTRQAYERHPEADVAKLNVQIYSNNKTREASSDEDKGRAMGYNMDDENSQSSLKDHDFGVWKTTEIKQTESPNTAPQHTGRWNNAR